MAHATRAKGLLPLVFGSLGAVGAVSAADQSDASRAREAAPGAPVADHGEDVTEVVVTGYRISLRNAIETKT